MCGTGMSPPTVPLEGTAVDLDEIRERWEKATPGPWRSGRSDMATVEHGADSKWIYFGGDPIMYLALASGIDIPDFDQVLANAEAIAAAPTDIASLFAEIERLRETNKRLNRRCQSAESGLAEKIEEAERAGGSMGRGLANAAAGMYKEQLADYRAIAGRVTDQLLGAAAPKAEVWAVLRDLRALKDGGPDAG